MPSPPWTYPDASFDFVYANSVFTHIPIGSVSIWVNEIARICRPGAAVIISIFNPDVHMLHLSAREFDKIERADGRVQWGGDQVSDRHIYFNESALRQAWQGPFEVLGMRRHFREQNHFVLRRTAETPQSAVLK